MAQRERDETADKDREKGTSLRASAIMIKSGKELLRKKLAERREKRKRGNRRKPVVNL